MDPGIIVPPVGYGGHERLVYLFAKEYARLGHDVHLLVTAGSSVDGCTVHDFGKIGFPPKKRDARRAIPKAWKFLWKHRNEFDLIHNFGRLIYLIPVLNHPVRKIMTYGREISTRNIAIINKLPNRNLVFTGCSNDLVARGAVAGRWETIYNAINFQNYDMTPTNDPEAPLVFLGRIERVKGCHTAIQVAKKTNRKLVIAGNVSPLEDEHDYFKKEIEPNIDNILITYVGAVNDIQKNALLGTCKALLFPIEWNEPFGIVMIEAMACGTPVIAYNMGSVNEVIKDGVNGFKVRNQGEMIQAIEKIDTVSRTGVRFFSEEKFDVKTIANQYLSLWN